MVRTIKTAYVFLLAKLGTVRIIAVDFDGTIVEHRYPRIGEEIPFAVWL